LEARFAWAKLNYHRGEWPAVGSQRPNSSTNILIIGSVFQAVLQLLSIAKQCEQRRDHTLLVRVLLCIANVHLINKKLRGLAYYRLPHAVSFVISDRSERHQRSALHFTESFSLFNFELGRAAL
jgi:hypothetical protein